MSEERNELDRDYEDIERRGHAALDEAAECAVSTAAEIDILRRHIAALEAALAERTRELDEAEMQLSALIPRIGEMAEKLDAQSARLAAAEERVRVMREALEWVRGRVHGWWAHDEITDAMDDAVATKVADAIAEHEAAICPEDFGCAEVMASLRARLAAAEEESDRLRYALLNIADFGCDEQTYRGVVSTCIQDGRPRGEYCLPCQAAIATSATEVTNHE